MTKQPLALKLADGNDECAKAWLESSDAHKFRKETAAELRRLYEENKDAHAVGIQQEQMLMDAEAKLHRQDALLRQALMWVVLLAELTGCDPEATTVEFSEFDDGSPSETISIASTTKAIRTHLEGEKT